MEKIKDAQLRSLLNAVASLLSDISTAQARAASFKNVDRSPSAAIQKLTVVGVKRIDSVQLQVVLPKKIHNDLKTLEDRLGFATIQEITMRAIEEGIRILGKKHCDNLSEDTTS